MNNICNVTAQFLCCVPMNKFNWSSNLIQLDNTSAELFIAKTIYNDLTKKYPLPSRYIKKFLKKVIQQFEDVNITAPDIFYSTYAEMMTSVEQCQDYAFKIHYIQKHKLYIPMLESTNFLSGGTTGLTTWQGALQLSEWCMENVNAFNDKNVIELGCGAGFLGIVNCLCCEPRSYTFTDCNEKVLELLNKNIINNIPRDKSALQTEVYVENLNWLDFDKENQKLLPESKLDIILAADVVFDPDILEGLCRTLSILLSTYNSLSIPCAYIAVTVRNETTFDTFLKTIDNFHLQHTEEDNTCIQQIFYYDSGNIKILKIISTKNVGQL